MPIARESDRTISLSYLERIFGIVTGAQDPEVIIDQILIEICAILRADACWVQLFDPNKQELALIAQRGFTQRMLKEINPLLGQILSSRVIISGEPLVSAGVFSSTDGATISSSSTGLHSFAVVPLKLHGKILGAVGLASKTAGKFTKNDLKFLFVLSTSIAIVAVHGFSFYDDNEDNGKNQLLSLISEKQELFSSLGHELQTPLTALIASAGLLAGELEKEPKPSQLRLIQNIIRSSSNLQERIMELLDLSRNKSTQLSINLKSIIFSSLLNEVVEELSPLVKSKSQSLVTDIPLSTRVIADVQRLNQILLNLLSNAIKFTPKGGQIIIKATEDKTYLVVEVQDTGPGISKREQMKLFRPYYRVPADRLLIPGLGLGLFITKQMVELLGGTIWVDSEPGKGSVFSFSLPLAES